MELDQAFDHCRIPPVVRGEVKRRYSEPHRAYHTLEHVEYMLRQVTKESSDALVAAIIFHDIHYAPRPVPLGFNEAMSAALFANFHIKAPLSEVVEMIGASAYHLDNQQHISEDTKIFLDLDLSGFAASSKVFRRHNDQIDVELANIYKEATPEQIAAGRHSFLLALSGRKNIFYVRKEWEEQARKNLANEIELMKSRF